MQVDVVNSLTHWLTDVTEAVESCYDKEEALLLMETIKKCDLDQFSDYDRALEFKNTILDKLAKRYKSIVDAEAYKASVEREKAELKAANPYVENDEDNVSPEPEEEVVYKNGLMVNDFKTDKAEFKLLLMKLGYNNDIHSFRTTQVSKMYTLFTVEFTKLMNKYNQRLEEL